MSSDPFNLNCWAISDGAAGNHRQVMALADALQLVPRVIDLRLRQPWDALAPHLQLAARSGMQDRNHLPIAAPWPDIAIGCGRRSALLTRCLRAWSRHRCFSVQILDPRIAPAHFDAVVAPRHDRLQGDNVIETLGALNPVDDAWLEQGRKRFPAFSALPARRTAVLIGASSASVTLDDGWFAALLETLASEHVQTGGSFLVSTSRRTPAARSAQLRQQFARWPGIFWGGPEDGENPYAGILGWADRIIVSPDSVNMVSEACATGKPVHAFTVATLRGKLAAFHEALRAAGHLLPLPADTTATHAPLRELPAVAARIRAIWHAKKPDRART